MHQSSIVTPDIMVASFDNKLSYSDNQNAQDSMTYQSAGGSGLMHVPTGTPGVSDCYVFKSWLQEYVHKAGIMNPVYETINLGPSHDPYFKSTVIVNGVRYDSLPGFTNRKLAEQSAAEVALRELSKCDDGKASVTVPVHETGLCKNLLQEYAQKMNYAIPLYISRKDDTTGRTPTFWSTVEIGGIKYIGGGAKTKKEADIKAARTALLAIHSSTTSVASENISNISQYTVVPSKRKVPEIAPRKPKPVRPYRPRKPRPMKKRFKKLDHNDVAAEIEGGNTAEAAVKEAEHSLCDVHEPNKIQTPHCFASAPQENGSSNTNQTNGDGLIAEVGVGQLALSSAQQPGTGNTMLDGSSWSLADENKDPVVSNVKPLMNDPPAASRKSDALVEILELIRENQPSEIEDRNPARRENDTGAHQEHEV